MISITRYRVWPDGDVQEADTPAHHWKSDDYELVEAPTPEDAWARAKANAPMVPELNYAAICDAAFLRDRRWVQGTTGCVAFTLGAEWYRDQLLATGLHTLYKTNDPEAPAAIRDRNGEVVLSLCKVCGKAEGELGEPCHAPAVQQGWAREYATIAHFYANKVASRSQLPLMRHIDDGLHILSSLNASDLAKAAFCLHPIVQNSEALDVSWSPAYPLACEYRDRANAYLCKPGTDGITTVEKVAEVVGSMSFDCRLMLIADKRQNYADFIIAHYGTHPRSRQLDAYFRLWIAYLEGDTRLLAATPAPAPAQEPVDMVPRAALHAVERERDWYKTRAQTMHEHQNGQVWYWQGDGEDHPETLVKSLPVVIRADQLRELIAKPAQEVGLPEGVEAELEELSHIAKGIRIGGVHLLAEQIEAIIAALRAKGGK